MEKYYEIVIVGAGPNAINAYYKLKEFNKSAKIVIFDKGNSLNNLRNLPEVRWHSTMKELKLESSINAQIDDSYIPMSSELIRYYEEFIKEHQIMINEFQEVKNIIAQNKENYNYKIEVKDIKKQSNHFVFSKNILICTGIYENKRKLDINTAFDFCSYESNLSHRNKNLVLVGGGGSAIDFILNLLPHNKITWIIKRDTWKNIRPNLEKTFKKTLEEFSSNLKVEFNTEIKQINNDRSIILSNKKRILNIDKIHILIGHNSKSELLKKIEAEFNNECLNLDKNFQTSLKGIYAFGSIMSKWDLENNKPLDFFVENGHPQELKKIIRDINKQKILDFMPNAYINPKVDLQKKLKPSLKIRISTKAKHFIKKLLGLKS